METIPKEGDESVRLLDGEGEAQALITLFEAIARQEGWQPGNDLREYQKQSVYFAAYAGGELAGGLQLVLARRGTILPVLSVWPELEPAWQENAADVALVALLPAYRARRDLLWSLFLAMWRWCDANAIAELWSEVPLPNLRPYNRLGWNLRVAGPPRAHWGEPCVPCRVGVQELAAHFRERARRSTVVAQRLAQVGLPLTTATVYDAAREGGAV